MSEGSESLLGAAGGGRGGNRGLTSAMITSSALAALGSCQFGWALGVTNEPQSAIETDLSLPPNGVPFAMAVAATSLAGG